MICVQQSSRHAVPSLDVHPRLDALLDAELLPQASRQVMIQMVSIICKGLANMLHGTQHSRVPCCIMHTHLLTESHSCLDALLVAELLTQASRQIMIEMVSIVFKGLADIPDVPMTPTTARSLAELAHSPRLQVSPDSHTGPILSPFLPGGTMASTAGVTVSSALELHSLSCTAAVVAPGLAVAAPFCVPDGQSVP